MRAATAFLFALRVLFSIYIYFRNGCHKAYAPRPLGILGNRCNCVTVIDASNNNIKMKHCFLIKI